MLFKHTRTQLQWCVLSPALPRSTAGTRDSQPQRSRPASGINVLPFIAPTAAHSCHGTPNSCHHGYHTRRVAKPTSLKTRSCQNRVCSIVIEKSSTSARQASSSRMQPLSIKKNHVCYVWGIPKHQQCQMLQPCPKSALHEKQRDKNNSQTDKDRDKTRGDISRAKIHRCYQLAAENKTNTNILEMYSKTITRETGTNSKLIGYCTYCALTKRQKGNNKKTQNLLTGLDTVVGKLVSLEKFNLGARLSSRRFHPPRQRPSSPASTRAFSIHYSLLRHLSPSAPPRPMPQSPLRMALLDAILLARLVLAGNSSVSSARSGPITDASADRDAHIQFTACRLLPGPFGGVSPGTGDPPPSSG